MRTRTLLIVFLSLFLSLSEAYAAEGNAADSLIEAAVSQSLVERREWTTLLHFYQPRFGSARTYVDDPDFFLAENGARDAGAELLATLQAFINEPAARCRFPARYNWLSTELDMSGLPVSDQICSDYLEWREMVGASKVVLVFAASYLNSPSSMYGHTFLRFDPESMEDDSPLLSYALNFGAAVDESDNGLMYAWRGIAGGYPGQFAASAYVKKLKEYTRLENRDLWEYHLALTPAEVDQMLAHVWELERITFDYYFFDENCSFRLLELIEVARPDLDLSSEYGVFALPIDTVRSVENVDLIERVYYRPSNQTILSHNLGLLDDAGRRLVLELSADINVLHSPLFLEQSDDAQNQIAFSAYRYLRYIANDEQRDEALADRSFELLRFMASREQDESGRLPPVPVDPLKGHSTMMLGVGGGAEDGKWFADYEWRLTYHDLLDETKGFPPDTSLNMGRIIIRQRESDGFQLQQFDLLEINSTAPRNEFYKPIAWRTSLGVDRQWTNGDDELAYQGNGGLGLSYPVPGDGRLVLMARARAEYNEGFRDSKLDAGGGGSVMYVRQNGFGNTLLEFETLHFIGGTDRQLIRAEQNFVITHNHALRAHFKRSIDESDGYNEAGIAYRYYF